MIWICINSSPKGILFVQYKVIHLKDIKFQRIISICWTIIMKYSSISDSCDCSLNSCVKFTQSQIYSEFYIQQWRKLLKFKYKQFWFRWIGWNYIHQLKKSMSDFVNKQYPSTIPLRSLVEYGNKLILFFFLYQNNRYAAKRPVFSSQYCD